MKPRMRAVALNLSLVGLALMAPAAPPRAAQLVPTGLRTSNGPRASKLPSTVNVLGTLNGMCPSNFPCRSSRLTPR